MKCIAIRSKQFKGFFEIPGFSRYVVSRDGIVIDVSVGELKYCGKNPAGYYNYFLYKDDGNRTTMGRHRLLGIVFLHPGGDITDLVVNHINGVKGDDRLVNLEWMTHQKNIEHAGMMGLSDKCLPVSVRDSYSGEIKHFPSIIECARYYGMSKDAINYRTRSDGNRVFPEGRQYRVRPDGPWYIPRSVEYELKKNRDRKTLLVRHVFYGIIQEYPSASRFCEATGINPATVSKWLSYNDQPILPGLLQVKWGHDETPWREVDDPIAEYNERSKFSRIVQVENDVTKERHYFLNATACSKHSGISTTALDYRLNTHGKVVFSDGLRYMYYTASPTGQKWSDGILLN